MESRLKERLTGAAIVVALVVLLVPEMFRGQRGDGAARPGGSAEGPPLRSYTIDLTNSPARTEPLPSSASATGYTGQTAAATAAAASAAPLAAQPVSAHPPLAHAAPTHPATAPAQGGWSVQLGLFARRENAERLMHAAVAKGFAVGIAGPDARGRYRVHATGLPDRAAAQGLSERLRARGFAASIAAPP